MWDLNHEKHEMTWGWENQNHEWTRMDTNGHEWEGGEEGS